MKPISPLAILVACAAGCGASQTTYVKPWFRVVDSPRRVLAPHAIERAATRHAEMHAGSGWRRLPYGGAGRGAFFVQPLGEAVAVVESPPASGGTTSVFIHRGSDVESIPLPAARCPSPWVDESAAEVTCFGCGSAAPWSPLRASTSEACRTLHVERFDAAGRSIDERTVASPIRVPEVEGRLPTGEWIVAEAKAPDDALLVGAPRGRYALGADGFEPLPFGADPLGRERDAARRAQAVLEAVRARDAAVERMRTAFAEDEHGRPAWVLRDERVNRLAAGTGMEPDIEVTAGRCYTLVARGSERGMTLAATVRAEPSTAAPSMVDARTSGPMQGAGAVETTRCVRPGDPPKLRFRIEAVAQAGYVLGRIYEHAP